MKVYIVYSTSKHNTGTGTGFISIHKKETSAIEKCLRLNLIPLKNAGSDIIDHNYITCEVEE